MSDYENIKKQGEAQPGPGPELCEASGVGEAGEVGVEVELDGPYRVSATLPLRKAVICRNAERVADDWQLAETCGTGELDSYYLCRCGGSHTKPFCDGHHNVNGFVGSEEAGGEVEPAPYRQRAQHEKGKGVDLYDNPDLCAGAGFCELHGTVWKDIDLCEDASIRQRLQQQVDRCPSGRLCLCDKEGGFLEADQPREMRLVQDPDYGCRGPLWLLGGVEVRDHKGQCYERRQRVTLCRCGDSGNKPFCDGSHYDSDAMKGTDDVS